MPVTVRSYAKINLGLAIGPARSDGFHTLLTLYQTIALHDLVTVSARLLPPAATKSRLSMTSDNPRVPCDLRNTAWRAVMGVLERLCLHAEVHIDIQKRLPIQGGLGAGSANAAAALIGLERELHLNLHQSDRLLVAADVGSDVPLFLVGGTVLGTGRGEVVEPVQDLPATLCVIALPDVGVSTPRAFRDWDATEGLTSTDSQGNLKMLSGSYALLSDASVSDHASLSRIIRSGIENDFEQVVFLHYPELLEIKRTLIGGKYDLPCLHASLSGSGSALYGLYATSEAAQAAQYRLQSSNVQALVTETLPRELYWSRMIAGTLDRP